MAKANRAALFGLLNFYREYVPHFAEVTEPLRRLLGDDSKPWTEAVTSSVREVASLILNGVSWLSFDRDKELRVETRVTQVGMSMVMLQRDPKSPREWAPVAGWGRALAHAEHKDPLPLLELRALQEGLRKLALHAAHCQKLTLRVSREAVRLSTAHG